MAHRALSGPADRVHTVASQHDVVQVEATGRLARLLVRVSGPLHDPAWTVREITLEELVLAYMSHPDAGLPSRPARGVPS